MCLAGISFCPEPPSTPSNSCAHICNKPSTVKPFSLDQLPNLQNTQVAWLLLSSRVSPRAHHACRTLPTISTLEYATRNDAAIQQCLNTILFDDGCSCATGPSAWRSRSAKGCAACARFVLGIVGECHSCPTATGRLLLVHSLQSDVQLPAPFALLPGVRAFLSAVGFEPPSWDDQLAGQTVPLAPEAELHLNPTLGWQRAATW